jgi:hypothetical protein
VSPCQPQLPAGSALGELHEGIRVEHGIAHLKNWRALTRHLGRREHMSHTVQAIAGLLSHQQTADPRSARPM